MNLVDRIFNYEKMTDLRVLNSNIIVVRLDGNNFSKYTKNLKKPFDLIFSESMILATKDVILKFPTRSAYVQSDEVSLVIYPDKNNHMYNGRVQKITSLIASYLSISFNKHFINLTEEYKKNNKEDSYTKTLDLIKGTAIFDARVIPIPNEIEAFNSILARNRDCIKNSMSMFAQQYCSHKELLNLSSKEQVEYCKSKSSQDWYKLPDNLKYGTIIKKEKYIKKATSNTKSKETTRTRLSTKNIKLEYSTANVELINSICIELDNG